LPYELRQQFKTNYENVRNKILEKSPTNYKTLSVGRDTSRLSLQLLRECNSMIKFLDDPEPVNKEQLRAELIVWLNKWDKIYKLNATGIYPEYKEFFQKYGYEI
jgi:hypothetical protein